jgi:tetratricopeptide (TPR) repeat protein
MTVAAAENLLGRAYWFLSSTEEALESFRRNIPRRTPGRFNSMYYIGRVMLDEGEARELPDLLGDDAKPLPDLDRNGDPVIDTALQAFNFIRQSPDIGPTARAWRWATFDLARLRHLFAERARKAWEADPERSGGGEESKPWLDLYDSARARLTEALERYPLRRDAGNGSGGGYGLSVRVEPEDYADTMAARFGAEYLLADTLLVLADNRGEGELRALARAHLENLRDRGRYANALFDRTLDRFQLNAAVIREEMEGDNWDKDAPLPRTRLGDGEGPTHSPTRLTAMLRNSMMLLGEEYFRAGEEARASAPGAGQGSAGDADAGAGFYRDAYRTWQDFYDRFGLADGPQAMVRMGDCLGRLGFAADAGNHYRMAVNMAGQLPEDTRADGLLDIGPAFWGGIAAQRLRDAADGYTVP